MPEKKEPERNVSITVTVNLGNYQNVKVMLSKTIESETFEEISGEITENLANLLPDIIEKSKKALKEYEEIY